MARKIPFLKVTIDLTKLFNFKRKVGVHRKDVYKTAMQTFVKYLHRRYVTMSNSGWPRLEQSTLDRKKARKKKYGTPANPKWVLRETLTLVNSLEGWVTSRGFAVGYKAVKKHPSTPDRKSSILITRLAAIHHYGEGQKRRPIVVLPDNSTLNKMVKDIEKEYGRIIERSK